MKYHEPETISEPMKNIIKYVTTVGERLFRISLNKNQFTLFETDDKMPISGLPEPTVYYVMHPKKLSFACIADYHFSCSADDLLTVPEEYIDYDAHVIFRCYFENGVAHCCAIGFPGADDVFMERLFASASNGKDINYLQHVRDAYQNTLRSKHIVENDWDFEEHD